LESRNGNSSNDLQNPQADNVARQIARDTENPPTPIIEATQLDADLQALIATWPTLPDALKAGILAMVKASGNGGGQ